jgi:pyruvate/2-oxoglutarate dehydrogenase complex dihydrolipoamide acyltransferase (E2) component
VRAGAVAARAIARDGKLVAAKTVVLCASVDHRALDGMDAGALLGAMKRVLEAWPLESES